jgi:hypothetical protein
VPSEDHRGEGGDLVTTVGRFVDGTAMAPVSRTPPGKAEEIHRARLEVCRRGVSVEERLELLAMLGLAPTAGEIAALNPEYIEDTVTQAETATEGPA